MSGPRIAIWQALYPDKHDIDAFISLFYEELETGFTADIACCDACYDAFVKRWPGIEPSTGFQESGYDLELFYSSSRLHEVYTLEEFKTLCNEMGCPQCGAPLQYNMWPHNFSFSLPPRFEEGILELENIAVRTPFLVLQHPLAIEVLGAIETLSKSINETTLPLPFYRARPFDTAHEISQFLAPPAKVCGEGRYNHAGIPFLYLASRDDVAFAETGSPDKGVAMASITILDSIKILDLSDESLPSDLLQAITVSSLLSAPTKSDGWDRPEYFFSRFVADCAYASGFSGIKYPSVANKRDGYNLVLFTPAEKNWESLVRVDKISDFPKSE